MCFFKFKRCSEIENPTTPLMDGKCEAYTHKGTRCSRKGTPRLCKQHSVATLTVTTIYVEEPWVKLGLPTPSPHLSKETVHKLRRKLTSSSSSSGGGGFIYVYHLAHESGRDFWKIGMTTRKEASVRLGEWYATHKVRLIADAEYRCIYRPAAWVERVIHLYLEHVRVIRRPLRNKEMYSVWYTDGSPLETDDDDVEFDGRQRHIEWFHTKWNVIESICKAVTQIKK